MTLTTNLDMPARLEDHDCFLPLARVPKLVMTVTRHRTPARSPALQSLGFQDSSERVRELRKDLSDITLQSNHLRSKDPPQ